MACVILKGKSSTKRSKVDIFDGMIMTSEKFGGKADKVKFPSLVVSKVNYIALARYLYLCSYS